MESPKGNLPYRLIYELGNAFASRLELVPLIELVTSKCREVLDADGVAVMLLDAESQELYFPYFSDRDPKVAERLARVRVPVGKGIAGEVFQTCRSVKIDNVSTESHFYSGVDKKTGLTTRSLLAAPLVANEVRLGVIEAVNPLGREAFSDNDLALLEALADSVALAIHNAHRVAKLKASEEMLRTEVGALRRDLARHELVDEIIGVGPEMAEVYHLMNSAAVSPISVLLVGETGSGKEHVARAIHRMSARADKPFLAVNCAALSEHLLNSELFGHRRGAFTGADRDQPGFFRAASGGIIFLDEIGEMPLCDAADAAARASGRRDHLGRRYAAREGQREDILCDQQRSQGRSRGGQVSRRPLLPARCFPDPASTATRAAARHTLARGSLPGDGKRAPAEGDPRN